MTAPILVSDPRSHPIEQRLTTVRLVATTTGVFWRLQNTLPENISQQNLNIFRTRRYLHRMSRTRTSVIPKRKPIMRRIVARQLPIKARLVRLIIPINAEHPPSILLNSKYNPHIHRNGLPLQPRRNCHWSCCHRRADASR